MVGLASVSGIPDSILAKLRSLGYDSLEQVLSAAEVASPELSRFLGVDLNTVITASVARSASTLPAAAKAALDHLPCSLGAATPSPTAPLEPVAADVAALPAAVASSVDLRPGWPWPVLDQGDRGTCVAHAAVACLERHFGSLGSHRDMSEQFVYWNCKRNDGHPTLEGTWVSIAFRLLQRDGAVEEVDWPYDRTVIPGNEGHDPPPGGAGPMIGKALAFRIAAHDSLPARSVQDLKNALAAGKCVAFSIPVFNSWYRSTTVRSTGDITLPIPTEVAVGGHAMCLVGYVDRPGRPELGGGRFILRNSWGPAWGQNGGYGGGYGTVPYLYISRHAMEAFAVA